MVSWRMNHATNPEESIMRGPMHTYNHDGQTRFDGNYGSSVNCQPNSLDGANNSAAPSDGARGIFPTGESS